MFKYNKTSSKINIHVETLPQHRHCQRRPEAMPERRSPETIITITYDICFFLVFGTKTFVSSILVLHDIFCLISI